MNIIYCNIKKRRDIDINAPGRDQTMKLKLAVPYADPLPGPFVPLPELVAGHAESKPDEPAVIAESGVVTHAGLARSMEAVAVALIRDGIQPGETVACVLFNGAEFITVMLGALRAGACFVPLPYQAAPDALLRMLKDSGASHVFVDPVLADKLVPAFEGAARIIVAGESAAGAPGMQPWIAGAKGAGPVGITPDMPFNIIYSSGTTGEPKGIIHDHAIRARHVNRMAACGMDGQSRTIVSTPLYSNAALITAVPSLALGGTLVVMRKFDTTGFLDLVERERITHGLMVPTQFQRLLASPEFDRHDLGSFRTKFSSGAYLPIKVKREILARWPGRLLEIYGQTEGGVSTMLDCDAFPEKLHTVGRPAPGGELYILREDGTFAPAGETGEIVGRTGAMMRGYHKQEKRTQELIWKDDKGRIFFRSGDLGRLDPDGFLEIQGRRKDMIVSGGFNIYAVDLEEALLAEPGIQEAAVIAAPSAEWGETPVAFVVADASVEPETLRAKVNARLGKVQRISAIVRRDNLPKSEVGKVLKRELQVEWERAGN
jgi:acyl-CoA synthetase (AMP-forming)/AMP-acid ligase II